MNHNILALAGLLHGINNLGHGDLKSHEFIEKQKQKFINAGLWDNGDGLNLMNYVAGSPISSQSHSIISLAAFWSSGVNINTENKINRKPLYSVFNMLSTQMMKDGVKEKYAYRPGKYTIDQSAIPEPATGGQHKLHSPNLWQQFENDFNLLPDGDGAGFIYSLFHLLKIYGWFAPLEQGIDFPVCSLFEYLKTTGAFAHCISAYLHENPAAKTNAGNQLIAISENHYPALMVCGDISGIQNYIYYITNKNAMKSLKGRSFFIQLLTETIADEILDSCEATIINQVYVSGGKFYLLLPNTTEVKKQLENYKKNIQLKLWDTYKGKLTCNISSLAFTMKSEKNALMACIEGENNKLVAIGDLWEKLSQKTAGEKRKKFTFIIDEKYTELFTPQGIGGKVEVCAITSEELTEHEMATFTDDKNEEIKISPQIAEQIALGQKVNNAKYLVGLSAKSKDGFQPGLNIVWDLVKDNELNYNINKYINISGDNFPDITPAHTPGKHAGIGFKIFGSIENPTNHKGILSLEDLCRHDDGKNIEKLGILRMDVDDLGNLFINGFMENGKNTASFASLATLSATLTHFFGGYINVLRHTDKFKNHVNIVYSGGDDVFAVGRWDKLLLFAISVRENFKKFVCNRDDITLSAGMAIINHKFPIAKGAEIAGDMEKMAKNNVVKGEKGDQKKDSITLFGIPLHWHEEMPFVIEFKKDLVKWLNSGAISKGLLMKIFSYYHADKEKEISWQWQLAYTLARYAKGAKDAKKDALDQIKTLIFTNSYNKGKYKNLPFAATVAACRWAELEFKMTDK